MPETTAATIESSIPIVDSENDVELIKAAPIEASSKKQTRWSEPQVKVLLDCLSDLKAEGKNTSMPSVLKTPEVEDRLNAVMRLNGFPWTAKQCQDKFKNILKIYRAAKRSQRFHTGNGEKPLILYENEMKLIVNENDPAINPPVILDGDTEIIAEKTREVQKMTKRTSLSSELSSSNGKDQLNAAMLGYFKVQTAKLGNSNTEDELKMRKQELKLKAMQFLDGKSEKDVKKLNEMASFFLSE